MASSLLYFAYGSNLLTARLRRRVPSATPKHVGFVNDYVVRFHKRSVDASGKATLVESAGDQAYGTVFAIAADEKPELDRVEGVGIGYHGGTVRVQLDVGEIEAFTYFAASTHLDATLLPYDWYVALVEAGAHEHDLPTQVIKSMAPSRESPTQIPPARTRIGRSCLTSFGLPSLPSRSRCRAGGKHVGGPR